MLVRRCSSISKIKHSEIEGKLRPRKRSMLGKAKSYDKEWLELVDTDHKLDQN